MTSDKNRSSSLMVRPETDTKLTMEHTEPTAEKQTLPTVMIMTNDPSPCTPYAEPPMREISKEFPPLGSGLKATAKEISMRYLRHRLCMRELYIARVTLVTDIMSIIAVTSIVLMIIENELTFSRVNNQDTKASWSIKLVLSVTTAILIGLVLYYHYSEMSFYAYRNFLTDWRVQLSLTKITLITIELVVCLIHPIPRAFPHTNPEKINSNLTSLPPYPISYTAVDVGLGLPMFLRLYLLGRSIMVHSPVVRHIQLRSLGYLNRVPIDSYFLIKSYLEHWPMVVMMVFSTLLFFIGSWSLHACDYTTTSTIEHISMASSFWLFIVTFTTIGYGDLYPSSTCGRTVAAIIGLIGIFLSALLIAIIAQKFQLGRDEKYVHNFVVHSQLTKQFKYETANIIKFSIKSWYLRRRNKSESFQYLHVQRKLFHAIHQFQKIKDQQGALVDRYTGFIEVVTEQRRTKAHTEGAVEEISAIKMEMKQMREVLCNMNHNMSTLHNTLSILLDKASK